MLYIPKFSDSLKISTDEKVKTFALMNFCEYFKSIREKLNSNKSEGKNPRKVAESL